MRFLSALLFLFIIQSSAFSQDSISLNTIVEKAVKLSNNRPTEKVYLHFDKPYYALGDTIWFKAYLTMDQHLPSTLSKIVYIDVIAGKDSIVQSLKLPVVNSVVNGNITLAPLSYKQGNYRIRAYTTWMFNFKEDYFFHKNIVVGDAIAKSLVTHISYKAVSADKFPKITTRVSFRDQDGKPYANKKVTWKIVSGYDVLNKGKGTTDANGNLDLVLDGNKKPLNDASLVTTIEVSDLKSLNSTFALQAALPGKDVQFFPEGGDLITGVPTKIAFKAIKSDGLGITAKGSVVDEEGNVQAQFESLHLGMGVFTLVPQPNKVYKANVEFADGTKAVYNLPQVKPSGVYLSVSSKAADALNLKLIANDAYFEKNTGKPLYLIARSGGIVCYAAQVKLQNQVISAKIDKSKFPTGIAQLSVLTVSGQPLSERLTFVYHPAELSVNLKSDKPVYAARQKVKINVDAKNGAVPAEGNFSLSVINESKVPVNESSETTILSSLLLSSDLRGYIEKPNYYFHNLDEKKQDALDALLLTQGYHAFTYPDIINEKVPPVTFLPEQGIVISGILRMTNGMPVNKGNVRLIIPDKNFSTGTITNGDGRFTFSNVVFTDSSKVTLSAVNNVNSKNMMFTTDGVAFPSVQKNINEADEVMNIDSTLSVYLDNSKKQYFNSRTLQEVVIKARVEKKVSHADFPALTGLSMMADREVSGDRFKDCNNFLFCLQSLAPGVTYIDNNLFLTRTYQAGNKTPVQVFVNGMAVDVNYLNGVNPNEVESVEVFFKDDLSGINRRYNTNGVVVVNMREKPKGTKISAAQLKELFPSSNTLSFTPQGYSKTKRFYVPKYEVPASSMSKPDMRTTVYWNPTVLTDKATGAASFEFYNADGKGVYKAVLEGIDKDGHIGRFIYRYTVK